jgi:lysophospholipase L1-like esterase
MTFYKSLFFSVFLFLFSCDDSSSLDIQNVDTKNSILPMGDSRVAGDRPDYASYRYALWKLLLANDYDFDLIGTREDNSEYPRFMEQRFDGDHQAEGGATTNTLVEMEDEISMLQPTVILLGIGGNDLVEGQNDPDIVAETLNRMALIIDGLRDLYPEVTILTPTLWSLFERFNTGIIELASEKHSADTPLLVVDMVTGWQDSYLIDEVHYTEEGAMWIAERYYDVLRDVLQ